MGRPYAQEMAALQSTYSWASRAPLGDLPEVLGSDGYLPLIAVGSGGSLTAAKFMALLHEELGAVSKAITPLDLLSSEADLSRAAVALLSARGENVDALRAFDRAARLEPRGLLGLCLRQGSTLAKRAKRIEFAGIWEATPNYGSEGFLAVNSLLAFSLVLLRAYAEAGLRDLSLPGSLEALYTKEHRNLTNLGPQLDRVTLLALHGKWGNPAASDLESKFSEVGLGNVLVSDYRNFAHGRHNWLDKQPSQTAVVAFSTRDDNELANDTLSLLPREIPLLRVSTEHGGPLGAISLLTAVFSLTGVAGERWGIDPGRPHVKSYGRRLYHLRPTVLWDSFPAGSPLIAGARRKALANGATWTTAETRQRWIRFADGFMTGLREVRFGGLVLDYDGTVCGPRERFTGPLPQVSRDLVSLMDRGTLIGVATGRGRSVREDLRRVIPRSHWDHLLVGYYNGGQVGKLSDDTLPDKDQKTAAPIQELAARIASSRRLGREAKSDVRPTQISFEPMKGVYPCTVLLKVGELIANPCSLPLKVYTSTHTVDAVPIEVSKRSVLAAAERLAVELGLEPKMLCIGDAGRWPGNDCELLSTPYSLSVDQVSTDERSCWNLSPPGVRGSQALHKYINQLSRTGAGLRFRGQGIGSST